MSVTAGKNEQFFEALNRDDDKEVQNNRNNQSPPEINWLPHETTQDVGKSLSEGGVLSIAPW